MRLAQLNDATREKFTAALGPVFEHSPVDRGRGLGGAALRLGRGRVRGDVGGDRRGRRGHEARADPRTSRSRGQGGAGRRAHRALDPRAAGAGLDRLDDEEFERFHRLNAAYRERFGFPFIVAVRLHTKDSILEAFERRLANGEADEMEEALRNIALIGRFRLFDLLQD